MKRFRVPLALLAILSFIMLSGFEGGGCGEGLNNRVGEPGINVGGLHGADWNLTIGDVMNVRVKNASGVVADYTINRVTGGSFSLEGETVDLRAMCERGEIVCPDEMFPSKVRMSQPGLEMHLLYVSYAHPGPDGKSAKHTLIGNVDSDWDMSVALGAGITGGGPCAMLSYSYFGGHIEATGDNPPMGTGLAGDIVTSYSGACLLGGTKGAAAGGLTVELRMPVSGHRGDS